MSLDVLYIFTSYVFTLCLLKWKDFFFFVANFAPAGWCWTVWSCTYKTYKRINFLTSDERLGEMLSLS